MHSELGKRGTPHWAFKRLSEGWLPRLHRDLIATEDKGVTEQQCRAVHQSLQELAALAAEIPDGPFFTIRAVTERLARNHLSWNEVTGSDSKAINRRRTHRERFGKTRQKIARRLRKNGPVIDENLDLERLRATHRGLNRLAETWPDTFQNLASVAKEIAKALSKHGFF